MDNLDSAIEYGYITEKEAELLELLRMPAKDAKPPKGVPKTHVPKKKGKPAPKETLKKLSPKQKATLKAKTDGKVEKTEDGIDSFWEGDRGNSVGSAGASNYAGNGAGGQVNLDRVGGDTGNVLRNIAGVWTVVSKTTGDPADGDSGRTNRTGTWFPTKPVVRAIPLSPATSTATSALAVPAAAPSGSYFGDIPSYAGTAPPAKTAAPANSGSYFSDISKTSAPQGTVNASREAQGNVAGTPSSPSQGGQGTQNASREAQGTVSGAPATQSGAGKQDLPNRTDISKTPGPAGQVGPANQNVYKGTTAPTNVTFIDKTPPSDLDDVMPSVTQAERAILGQVKQPTSFARIDSPSSLANLGPAGSSFETPLADRPGVYSGTELSDIVRGSTPARANLATREAYADNIASDPTAGRTNDSLASLAGKPEKITDRVTPNSTSTMTENYADRAPPTPASVAAARSAILGDVAQAAGTPTAGYQPAPPAPNFQSSLGRYGLPEINPATYTPAPGASIAMTNPPASAALAAGTLTTPYERETAIPGVEPAKAAGTVTAPYNVAAQPDSPLSPLSTAKPRALGVDKYTGTSTLASLSTPSAPPANDNDSTIADQNMPDTSTIADQNLPGGLPQPSRNGQALGQGGQGKPQIIPTAGAPRRAAGATPPAPVVDQTDPYVGIMPWDRIAYDAIRTSYESRGEAYTPQQFITSFYNQRQAA